MRNQTYTAIPDTSDRNYWAAKPYNQRDRVQAFVPLDPELHKSLLSKQWEAIQSRHRKTERTIIYKVPFVEPQPVVETSPEPKDNFDPKAVELVHQWKREGRKLDQIAADLNTAGFRTPRNCDFRSIQVVRILKSRQPQD